MCRLFGLRANKSVDVSFSFYETPRKSFVELSNDNPDGWGIAWLSDEGWRIRKEPIALYRSSRAEELIRSVVRGRIIVSHVRRASDGHLSIENTHPWLYRGWAFAHNGTICNKPKLLKLLKGTYREGLEGETDSEAFFHLVVQEAEELGDPIEGFRSAVEKIVNSGIEFTSLNSVASDGEKLYALRYAREKLSYYTLYYIERPREGLEISSLSQETRQLISTKLVRGEKAVVVASEAMSDEAYWRKVPNKRLVVVDKDLSIELKPIEV